MCIPANSLSAACGVCMPGGPGLLFQKGYRPAILLLSSLFRISMASAAGMGHLVNAVAPGINCPTVTSRRGTTSNSCNRDGHAGRIRPSTCCRRRSNFRRLRSIARRPEGCWATASERCVAAGSGLHSVCQAAARAAAAMFFGCESTSRGN